MDSEGQAPANHSAALLLVIGEPFSEEHKQLILEEITKGFRSWDVEESGININEELAQIANRASLGEEGVNGERLIQHQSDNLSVEILVNPLAQTVKSSFKQLLMLPAPTKYVIFAGHTFQGTGAWVLQDDVFAFNNLAQVFKNSDVENALKQNIEANLTIHTLADTNWGNSISRADFTNNLRIQLNPPEKLENIHGVVQFTAYIGIFLKVTPVTDLLQASEQFGNISFTRPTLYIFPGCQGDSALFGINGFNLLVNGGYNRKACFWDFARHLDRVDAMLLTHLGTDNIFGINAALQRKTLENIHPQIGYLYFNAVDKPIPQVTEGEDPQKPSLLLNLAEEANKMTAMAKQLGITPHPCTRPEKATTVEPINLYHKLGHGSLDVYILNPVGDSKELKELYQLWGKQAANLGSSGPFALQNAMSVCTLLVWKPYNPTEKIVRILFPGNAPQHKVAEGLEKMKTFAFLKQASCTAKDLQKPAPVKKGPTRPGSGNSTARGATRTMTTTSRMETSRAANTSRLDSPRKADVPRARPTSATSPTKPSRPVRDETKAAPKPKPAKPEETKAKPSSARTAGATSPTKTGAASPRKAPSPTKTSASPAKPTNKAPSATKDGSPTKRPSPPKSPTKAKSASPEKEVKKESPAPEVKPEENAAPETVNAVTNHVEPEIQPELNQTEESKPLESAPTILKEGLAINGDAQNGDVADLTSPVQVNGDNDEEEIRPQALPEPPVIVESPSQESPGLPDYSSKIESDQQELSEFSKMESEAEQLENEPRQDDITDADPAVDIPSSPEPVQEEHDTSSTVPEEPEEETYKGFEAPVFTNDEPNEINGTTMEQKIQYGIDESSRAMEGIQEVEEEEPEAGDGQQLDKEALREMGIYDEDEEEEETNAFEKDDVEDEVRQTPRESSEEAEKYEGQAVEGDLRSSAERQFEDVDDEGLDLEDQRPETDQSSLPAAFDKDSSPEVDADSIEGANADEDKDVDETAPEQVNGQKSPSPAQVEKTVKAEQGGDESDDELREGSFDPVAQWGQPMGLPSPPPPTSPTKAADRRPASSTTTRPGNARNGTDTKRRPGTAPAKTSRPGTATRRPGSSRSSPQASKVPPLPPLTPFYMDLTYIPNHGDPAYSDVEFFKRIRARYYVLSALSPNPSVLDSLMEAKATWEQKDLEVTLIPTYDNETLRHWMGLNKEKLQDLHIDMTPAVSRCTIQLQDLETSLPAYRLEV